MSFAKHDHVGLDAVIGEGEERTGAAEVRLNFVEDEEDVVLAAEGLQELQIFLLRMVRTAAAEIGLGDQAADLVAEFRHGVACSSAM